MNQLTTAEAAALLGCDISQVRRLARQGKLAQRQFTARVVLYDRADVERYKRERHRGRPRKEDTKSPGASPAPPSP